MLFATWPRVLNQGVNGLVWDISTRFNKIAIQGTPHMAVDKEANSLSLIESLLMNTILNVT